MNCPKLAVAPMMDWTDRHCRYFLRLLSPSAKLYTEMVTAAALKFGDASRLLEFNEEEHPVVLQVGGSDPRTMAHAARLGADRGYDEININVGCPSDRVQSGQFGACLMAHPEKVASCIAAMQSEVDIPVTVKTRIGIDDKDRYDFLRHFVETTAAAGCEDFVVHARIAVLQGLSPKENRSVPPLNYDRVYQLKRDYPRLNITINGGVTSAAQVRQHLQHVDGVMIGREAYQNPWFLVELEDQFGRGASCTPESRSQVVQEMLPYVERELEAGAELKHITRHMLGILAGQPGARSWRRYLSEHSHRSGAGIEVLQAAIELMPIAA
jgi:tRNA-dihydrouridine synthase A